MASAAVTSVFAKPQAPSIVNVRYSRVNNDPPIVFQFFLRSDTPVISEIVSLVFRTTTTVSCRKCILHACTPITGNTHPRPEVFENKITFPVVNSREGINNNNEKVERSNDGRRFERIVRSVGMVVLYSIVRALLGLLLFYQISRKLFTSYGKTRPGPIRAYTYGNVNAIRRTFSAI